MDTTHASSGSTAEFYLPGTFQFSRSPGVIERFLARHLRSLDAGTGGTGPSSGRDFFLPATPRVRTR